jgi:CBS domain containing-hemolysin-like protein
MTPSQTQPAQGLAVRSAARLKARAVGPLAAVGQAIRDVLRRIFQPLATVLVARWVRSLSMDELHHLVLQARAGGALDARHATILTSVLEFHEKRAHDVMRPRTEIVALSIDAPEAEVLEVVAAEQYSRYPVYQETLDDVVGIFLVKDLLVHQHSDHVSGRDGDAFSLRAHIRPAFYVPATRRAELVFDDLRRSRAHMAIVLDEYGGTAGVVTMEDLVEQVVGEIADEYDPASRSSLETDGVLELEGTLSLIDVRSDYDLDIPEGDWATIGGYVFAQLGRVPRIGDRVGLRARPHAPTAPSPEPPSEPPSGPTVTATRAPTAAPNPQAQSAPTASPETPVPV